MQLLSTSGARFTLEAAQPPTPPSILSSLTDSDLRLYFERFAAFLCDSTDALSKAVHESCVSYLVQLSGAVPVRTDDSYVDGSGTTQTRQRCELLQPPSGPESLAALIVRRFEGLQATAPQSALEFQLYLYLAIHLFTVWYFTEIHCEKSSVIPGHQFPQQTREYVADYLKYYWAGMTPPAKSQWFGEPWFLTACTLEAPARLIQDRIRDRFKFNLGFWDTEKDRLAAHMAMAEALRAANIRLLESETRAIIDGLVGAPTGAGTALVDAYRDFTMYGLGNGSGTRSLFGKTNYGLGFFNYVYKLAGPSKGPNEPIEPNRVAVSATRTAVFPLRQSDHDSITFFYFGIEAVPLGTPSISFTPFDAQGASLKPSATFKTHGSADYRFVDQAGLSTSTVTAESLNVALAQFVTAEMRSDAAGDPEEVVFIVFRHRIGGPPLQPPQQQPTSLEAEWTFNDNRFASADAIGGDPFSDQVMQDSLKLIISQIVNTPNVDIQAYIAGFGVGESLNNQPSDPGSDLRPSPTQVDTHDPEASYDQLRYCYGRLLWTPSIAKLSFYAEGYVSPLRCTWDAHLVPTGSLTLQGEFGQFLKPTSQPSYNCVLSAFRAFSLCEGMMQAMMNKAVDMAFAGDITTVQANTLIGSLTAHLTQDASAQIITENGGLLMRHNPEQAILVTHTIFHSFKAQ